MKLVIATLKELHEINMGGGGGEHSKHGNDLDENKYD